MVNEYPFHTLLVCPRCRGFNYLTKHVMQTYIAQNTMTYCKECSTVIEVSQELRQVAREIKA